MDARDVSSGSIAAAMCGSAAELGDDQRIARKGVIGQAELREQRLRVDVVVLGDTPERRPGIFWRPVACSQPPDLRPVPASTLADSGEVGGQPTRRPKPVV